VCHITLMIKVYAIMLPRMAHESQFYRLSILIRDPFNYEMKTRELSCPVY